MMEANKENSEPRVSKSGIKPPANRFGFKEKKNSRFGFKASGLKAPQKLSKSAKAPEKRQFGSQIAPNSGVSKIVVAAAQPDSLPSKKTEVAPDTVTVESNATPPSAPAPAELPSETPAAEPLDVPATDQAEAFPVDPPAKTEAADFECLALDEDGLINLSELGDDFEPLLELDLSDTEVTMQVCVCVCVCARF